MNSFNNSEFVHLHNHSEYSAFDGQIKLDKFVMEARKMGFPAIALTDHGTVGGLVKFLKLCIATKNKKGQDIEYPVIKPIPGCELYMSRDRFANSVDTQPEKTKGNYHLTTLAKNFEGYKNLCTLSELSFLEGFYSKPRIDFDLLYQYHEGLICSSACLRGIINANLLNDRYDAAKLACGMFKDIFGEDFYLEIMYHGIGAEEAVIPDILKLSIDVGVPVITTNDIHYLKREHAETHEVLMCMNPSDTKCIKDKHLKFPYPEFYMKSAQEMAKMFGDIPQLLHNSLEIAERINVDDIIDNLFVSHMRLPDFEIPNEFKNTQEYLEHLAWQGMKKLGWDNSEKHVKQLNIELEDVKTAKKYNGYDFATYFLIEWDLIKWAKEHNILTGPGRGSGFASVLLRCLGITYGPDPTNFPSLLWERFLGFDFFHFIKPEDFGLIPKHKAKIDIDLDEDREPEDEGGVDRY